MNAVEEYLVHREQAIVLLFTPPFSAHYEVHVENTHGVTRGVARGEIDGVAAAIGQEGLSLVDDGATHRVRVWLG
jgi:hypothetical protein